jgi:hypothetical protein
LWIEDLLGAEVECGNRPLVARELFLNSRQGLGAGVRARAEAARKLGGVGPAELSFSAEAERAGASGAVAKSK